jgi:hypothetical protein
VNRLHTGVFLPNRVYLVTVTKGGIANCIIPKHILTKYKCMIWYGSINRNLRFWHATVCRYQGHQTALINLQLWNIAGSINFRYIGSKINFMTARSLQIQNNLFTYHTCQTTPGIVGKFSFYKRADNLGSTLGQSHRLCWLWPQSCHNEAI